MKYTYALVALLAAAGLAWLGWYATVRHPVTDGRIASTNAAFLPEPSAVSDDERNLRELQTVLANFQNAKSFRAHVTVQSDTWQTSGDVEIAKPNRFHGTMTVDGQTVDVIGVEDVLYVKSPENVWVPVKSEQLTAQLRDAFSAALDGADGSELLPAGTSVTRVQNKNGGCDAYRAAFTDTDGNDVIMDVCEENGYPARIDISRADGTVRSDYKDFNALIVIERPTIDPVFRSIVE